MTAARVAIVDDDDSLRNALTRLLRSASYAVEPFASATELWGSLSTTPMPSCIILDLQLPGMTGVELLQRFAQLVDPPAVLVITANDEARVREQCIALGAMRYFRKPIDCDALLEAVRETVGGYLR
jgi:FixJ family two-component response regulator